MSEQTAATGVPRCTAMGDTKPPQKVGRALVECVGVSLAHKGRDTPLLLCQHGSQGTPRAYSSRRSRGDPLYLGRAVTTSPHTRGRSLSWGVWTCAAVVRHDNPAAQERLPHCGTARHGVQHARQRFTSCTASRWSLPTTTTRRLAYVWPGRHAYPPEARCSIWPSGQGCGEASQARPPPATSRAAPRKALRHSWMRRKPRRIPPVSSNGTENWEVRPIHPHRVAPGADARPPELPPPRGQRHTAPES
jgi:hypothetical protein